MNEWNTSPTDKVISFRPQQGLTIMNWTRTKQQIIKKGSGFRPQQGLTIMNAIIELCNTINKKEGFRPQQGLTIMNLT